MDRPCAADWAGRLDLKRVGDEFKGPCPLCGGDDRFHAKDDDGQPGLIHCRGCGDAPNFYPAALKAAFGDTAVQAPKTWLKPARTPLRAMQVESPARCTKPTKETARTVLKAAVAVPAWVARSWRSGLLEHAPKNGLLWLARKALVDILGVRSKAVAGALVAPIGASRAAVHLMMINANGAKSRVRWCGKQLDKITLGPLKGRGFAVNKGNHHGPLYIVEGVADALAIATRSGCTAVAALGTSGFKSIPLALLVHGACPWKRIEIVPDGADEHVMEAAEKQVAVVQDEAERIGGSVTIRLNTDSMWFPDPAAAVEEWITSDNREIHPAAVFSAGAVAQVMESTEDVLEMTGVLDIRLPGSRSAILVKDDDGQPLLWHRDYWHHDSPAAERI